MDEEMEAPLNMDDVIGDFYDNGVDVEASGNETELETDTATTEEVDAVEQTETSETDETSGEEETETDDVDTDESEEAPAPISAPQSMSAKDREAFYKLPPDQQQWLTDRVKQQESDYTKKTMEIAEQRKAYEKLDQILTPRKQQLAMAGMDESTAVGQLFALSDFADRDPAGFIQYLAKERGVDLATLTQSGGQQQSIDPQLQAIQQELNSTKQFIQTQQMQQMQAQQAQVSSVIEDFSKDPQFAYYSELENDMVPIVQALKAQNPAMEPKEALSKAYKMALSANDEVSAKIEADAKAKQEAERIAQAKKEAAKAKKARGTSVKSKGGVPSKGKNMSMDDFISAQYDELMSG